MKGLLLNDRPFSKSLGPEDGDLVFMGLNGLTSDPDEIQSEAENVPLSLLFMLFFFFLMYYVFYMQKV